MKKHIFGVCIALVIFTVFAFIYGLFESNEHICVLRKPPVERTLRHSGSAVRIVQAVAERKTGKLVLTFTRELPAKRYFFAIFTDDRGVMKHLETVSTMGDGTGIVSIENAFAAGIPRPQNFFVVPVKHADANGFDLKSATPVVMEEDR